MHTLTSVLKTMATSLIAVALEMPFSPRTSGVIRQFMLDHHAPHIHQLRAFAQQISVIQAGKLIIIWQGKSKLHGGRYDWQYSGWACPGKQQSVTNQTCLAGGKLTS